MYGRAPLTRSGSIHVRNLGHNAIAVITNLCFFVFGFAVLIFMIFAVTYQPEEPLFHPTSKVLDFFMSNSNTTFISNETVSRNGKDFISPKQTALDESIDVSDASLPVVAGASECEEIDLEQPIPCRDPDIFHIMMRAAIEEFQDTHFYRFGKPVPGPNSSTCDMAWRYRPKAGKTDAFYKDYRRFVLKRQEKCNFKVIGIGGYHTGLNARKRKKNQQDVKKKILEKTLSGGNMPVIGEVVTDDSVETERSFRRGNYLIYTGGGDRCKNMKQYLWSFLCALGEARYLNRTLVMDLSLCLSSMYTLSNTDEEGKDFRFYFDFEHLRESASVFEQNQFWYDWARWQMKDGLRLYLVEDHTRVTPMKLYGVKEALIMRKFGSVEPDNYWYRVCEGKAESVISRPWRMIRKSKRLIDIVSRIVSKMKWDFDAVHIERGEKVKNTRLWPNLAADTSPEALLLSLGDKIAEGRTLYIATDEPDKSFFNPLKEKYRIHFLDDYKDLWGEGSEWHTNTARLNGGNSVEFDGFMRMSVDIEVFLRGKKQIETFNDLTSDCKNGVNTCRSRTT